MQTNKYLILLLGLAVMAWGCKSEYEQLVHSELKTGRQLDSLVLGMKRGMTKKDFYAHCWQLNKEQLVHQGSGNRYALYPFEEVKPTGDTLPMEMLFYGIFDDNDVMQGMDMLYTYPGWAPWNEALQVDSLIDHLVWLYMRDLGGNPFISIEVAKDVPQAFVKVDGDRQITIYPKNKRQVAVKMVNLHYKMNHDSE